MEIETAAIRTGDRVAGMVPGNTGVLPSVPREGGEKAGLTAVVEIRFGVNVHASLRTSGAAIEAFFYSSLNFYLFSHGHLGAFSASAVTSSAGRPVTVTVPPELVMLVMDPGTFEMEVTAVARDNVMVGRVAMMHVFVEGGDDAVVAGVPPSCGSF